MCCYLDHRHHHAIYNPDTKIIETGPRNFGEHAVQFLQRMELTEKVAELVDETFHLFIPLFDMLEAEAVGQFFESIHDGAHHFEQLLHSLCFINDAIQLVRGHFFKGSHIVVAARIYHFVAHIFSAAVLLSKLGIIKLGELTGSFRVISSAYSALGFATMTISLIWQKYIGEKRVHWQDIGLHFTGFIYFSIYTATSSLPAVSILATSVLSIAGIIHSSIAIYRLLPYDHFHVDKDNWDSLEVHSHS